MRPSNLKYYINELCGGKKGIYLCHSKRRMGMANLQHSFGIAHTTALRDRMTQPNLRLIEV